uniref:Uncharacterized protein n=1 Tax=Loa loa TaxID=7209 RepID=A0A1I7VZ67_LOALO
MKYIKTLAQLKIGPQTEPLDLSISRVSGKRIEPSDVSVPEVSGEQVELSETDENDARPLNLPIQEAGEEQTSIGRKKKRF